MADDILCCTWCNPASTDGSAPTLVIPAVDRKGQACLKRARGPKDLINNMGSVNFFKDFEVTPLLPHPQKWICQTQKGNSGKNIPFLSTSIDYTNAQDLTSFMNAYIIWL